MRRKSERNKAKGSPDKKTEKPTRKSARRRGKRSTSSSPERDNSNDKTSSVDESSKESTAQARLKFKDADTIAEEASEARAASATEEPAEAEGKSAEDVEVGGSVWKVARADASPGEIQKLKLCRQRNTSEASDNSQSARKRSNKWQESGEGDGEEVDSTEEQPGSCERGPGGAARPDDPSSSRPGQDSNEEVSDSKEILPETTSADLSDAKPNIDQRGDSNEASCVELNIDIEKSPKSSGAAAAPSSNGDDREEQTPQKEEMPMGGVEEEEEEEKVKVAVAKQEEVVEEKKEKTTEELRKESSSDEEKEKTRSESSTDEAAAAAKTPPSPPPPPQRSSRRKHRAKYRDSSDSESQDSEEEPPPPTPPPPPSSSSVERNAAESSSRTAEPEEKESPEARSRTPSPLPRANSSTPNHAEAECEERERVEKMETNGPGEKVDDAAISKDVAIVSRKPPAKVNLKRSFSARVSVDAAETKKDDVDGNFDSDSANQNKENLSAGEQDEAKSIPRKRRWGTALSTDAAPAFSVSTDSLKALVPGAKPLPINEVRLSKDDDDESDRRRDREKRYVTTDGGAEYRTREDGLRGEGGKKGDAKNDNHIAARRKISIVKDAPHLKSPSPPASKPTNILLIKNLVRPFTLNQIKELLSRTGTIADNGFWMDGIKSKCFVEYANEDQAFETRQALHGISWPVSNPKRLQVEYATKEDMELARELSKDQPIPRKTEPLAPSDGWQQEWMREERTNSTKVTIVREWDLGKEDGSQHAKEKERDKKDHEKKRRQRSRSPALEAHLPPPARKFKKKEDEPPPAKLLDDLFRKTKATPCIYWLPLTNEQIVVKEEMRRQHMAEHARRLEEMRRAERSRDGRRRRSPRK